MTDTIAAIKELLPEIRQRREEIEKARRMPLDLVKKFQATGVFALGAPKEIGGSELPLADQMRIVETIAAADGSTGWTTMLGMSSVGAAGLLSEIGQKEVFADPTAPAAGVAGPVGKAVRVDGGVRISGYWPFSSGITHSEWTFGGGMVYEGDAPKMTPHGPEVLHAWIPVSEVEIHDTWYVSGLSGTGSNDFSAEDIFVPDHRLFNLFLPSPYRTEPNYQFPAVALFTSQVAAVGLGVGRAALDELADLAQTKVPTLSMAVLADRSSAQIQIARAEAQLGAARSFLYDCVEDTWQTLLAGREVSPRQEAMNRISAAQAVETAANVAHTANVLAGGGAIYSRSPMQRHARDAEALMHHFSVSQHVWEDAGRVLLGRAPLSPIF